MVPKAFSSTSVKEAETFILDCLRTWRSRFVGYPQGFQKSIIDILTTYPYDHIVATLRQGLTQAQGQPNRESGLKEGSISVDEGQCTVATAKPQPKGCRWSDTKNATINI